MDLVCLTPAVANIIVPGIYEVEGREIKWSVSSIGHPTTPIGKPLSPIVQLRCVFALKNNISR